MATKPTKQNAKSTKQNGEPKRQNVEPKRQSMKPKRQGAKPKRQSVKPKRQDVLSPDIKEDEKQHRLINKLVVTSKNPTKESIKLCTQLRRILDPDCLSKLKEKHLKLTECFSTADHYSLSHIVFIAGKMLHIGARPNGPTCIFKIREYSDNFKSFSPAFYERPPFLTFQGKSELKQIFEHLGKNEEGFRRVLHIAFEDDLVYIRHYGVAVRNSTDNFRVKLREIGPRLTLELVKKNSGFYTHIKE